MAEKQAMPCPRPHVDVHTLKEEVRVPATIANQSAGDLHLLHKHSWDGGFAVKFPEIIRKGQYATFVLKGGSFGSKGAVVYSGVNDEKLKEDNCAWLLAWQVLNSAPNSPNKLKVYVECGPVNKYARIDWRSIEEKLNESCNVSHYIDETTGTEASGSIDNAKFAVIFGQLN